jgi:hypothetical protein
VVQLWYDEDVIGPDDLAADRFEGDNLRVGTLVRGGNSGIADEG